MTVRFRKGKITEITGRAGSTTKAAAKVGDAVHGVVNYDYLTGPVRAGDEVMLNTIAVDLKLGTGGDSFVVLNLSRPEVDIRSPGHIMKLRYTPWQFSCLSVEEDDSPHHQKFKKPSGLDGMPVVAGGLHSQLYPAALAIKKKKPAAKTVYIMTDGAALPISHSRTVEALKGDNLIAATITSGHTFGGDFEAVNIFSALQAAKEVVGADIALVMMGPGIVGTGSAFGHTGMEQGQLINAAAALGGCPVAVARIGFADRRERHRGVSHHTLAALGTAALVRATVALPPLSPEREKVVIDQLKKHGIDKKHDIETWDASWIFEDLSLLDHKVMTMGRGVEKDREFFLAAAAAGACAASMLDNDE